MSAVEYPKAPYMAAAVATFPSGFKRDLVAYGAPCAHEVTRGMTCGNRKTYLDGGAGAACKKHLMRYCKHGLIICSHCQTEDHLRRR